MQMETQATTCTAPFFLLHVVVVNDHSVRAHLLQTVLAMQMETQATTCAAPAQTASCLLGLVAGVMHPKWVPWCLHLWTVTVTQMRERERS
jgi:hypothetical protein